MHHLINYFWKSACWIINTALVLLHLHHTSLRKSHTNTYHASSFPKSYLIWWWALHSSYPKVSKSWKPWKNWSMIWGSWGNIQVFLIEMNRKQISNSKVLRFSWLRAEGFESLFQQLKHQKLKSFLELSGKIYLDLVKVFFTYLEFKNDVLLSSIEGVQMEINKRAWKDVVGLKSRGVP